VSSTLSKIPVIIPFARAKASRRSGGGGTATARPASSFPRPPLEFVGGDPPGVEAEPFFRPRRAPAPPALRLRLRASGRWSSAGPECVRRHRSRSASRPDPETAHAGRWPRSRCFHSSASPRSYWRPRTREELRGILDPVVRIDRTAVAVGFERYIRKGRFLCAV
jgi:hypothetical protein